jgi:hypothetical protein
MNESTILRRNAGEDAAVDETSDSVETHELPDWETPSMEDVSEQVMAQPYIRFT